MTMEQCVAANLLYRKGVSADILAKLFGVGKSTIYFKCLTGEAPSYPKSHEANTVKRVKAIIKKLGEEKAWKMYVTDEMQHEANRLNAEFPRSKSGRRRAA